MSQIPVTDETLAICTKPYLRLIDTVEIRSYYAMQYRTRPFHLFIRSAGLPLSRPGEVKSSKMSPVDPEGQSEADVLLREFIAADDPACVERLLCRLLTEYADPIICKIVRAKLHRQNECQDAEDVR